MSVKQRTLKGEFTLSGTGLHTGKEVRLTFKPAGANSGYSIVRTDVEGCPVIPATAAYLQFVDRASCLEKDGLRVFTMEHAIAALYGCEIANCTMEISSEAFPRLAGSAKLSFEPIDT